MNADYCDSIFEGVRCIMQVLDVTAARRDFWRVASTPRSHAEGGGTLWMYPDTWKMEEDTGFWRRAIPPQLRIAYKRSHLTSAVSKYLSDRQDVGSTPYDNAQSSRRRGTGKQIGDEQKRLYPPGAPFPKPRGPRHGAKPQ